MTSTRLHQLPKLIHKAVETINRKEQKMGSYHPDFFVETCVRVVFLLNQGRFDRVVIHRRDDRQKLRCFQAPCYTISVRRIDPKCFVPMPTKYRFPKLIASFSDVECMVKIAK